MTRGHTPSSERGTGGVEVLAIGFLVLFAGTLLVASAWAVIDTKMAAISASREAARVAVESPEGDVSRLAKQAAVVAWTAHGKSAETLAFQLTGSFYRCGRVLATTSSEVKPIRMPWIGSWGSITVSARHSEIVDPYRSGLSGEAECDA
jgi:Flp pilus assembly protein TadG